MSSLTDFLKAHPSWFFSTGYVDGIGVEIAVAGDKIVGTMTEEYKNVGRKWEIFKLKGSDFHLKGKYTTGNIICDTAELQLYDTRAERTVESLDGVDLDDLWLYIKFHHDPYDPDVLRLDIDE